MSTEPKNKKGFFYVAFILIIILNLASGCIKMPQDLKDVIAKKFSDSADDIKKQSVLTVKETEKNITDIAQKHFAAQSVDVYKQLAEMKKEISLIAKVANENSKTLTAITTESNRKSQAYLAAAREIKNKLPDAAQILYVSALSLNQEKTPVLNEFIEWQNSLIEQDLRVNNIDSAQDRLTALIEICNTNMVTSSISDIKKLPEIKKKIASIDDLIKNFNSQIVADQEKKLDEFTIKLAKIKQWNDAQNLIKELTQVSVSENLKNRKIAILNAINMKSACLTTPEQELEIPEINEYTPYSMWLKNFNKRLVSKKLKLQQKLEDLGNAADFIQVAKKQNDKAIVENIKQFEVISKNLYLEYWQNRADKILDSNKKDINEISHLLVECNNFDNSILEKNKDRIVNLHSSIFDHNINDLRENIKHLNKLKDILSAETYIQLIGIIQNQYLQLLMQVQAAKSKYSVEFLTEFSEIQDKITGLSQIIRAYREKIIIADINKSETQREEYRKHASKRIKEAQKLYDEGEDANGDEAKQKYADAWYTLVRILPGDLQAVAPEMYQDYNKLKEKIENRWKPHMDDKKSIKHERIHDF